MALKFFYSGFFSPEVFLEYIYKANIHKHVYGVGQNDGSLLHLIRNPPVRGLHFPQIRKYIILLCIV